jgi:pyruvate kinase
MTTPDTTSSGSKFAACNATSFSIADRKKTKIVATVGPASRSPENLRSLMLAGVDVFRLNFSHGSYQEHKENLDNIRFISAELCKTVGVLQDLAGPKIRITPLKDGNPQLEDNQEVELHLSSNFSDSERLSCPAQILVESVDPVKVCRAGDRVLLADGIICLDVTEVHNKHVLCKVVKGGRLRSRVGIAFPDGVVDLPATTEKDLKDFSWGMENKVDYVAISFVQTADDLLRLRKVMAENDANIQIISKIERKVALDNIESILDQSDGVMVARGDLGLELPLEQVPHVQRALIKSCNQRGIPVIVATQMLSSMVTSIRPTRAEATDVAFAVLSGADAVMLSEETAIGEHPADCVKYLARIALEAESHPTMAEPRIDTNLPYTRMPIPDAIAFAACGAARKVNAKAIIACTTSGTSARLVSKYRPSHPIFAVSTVEETLRRMSLCWGVIPMKVSVPADPKDEISAALLAVQKYARFEPKSLAVVTGSGVIQTVGATNVLEVQELPAVF